MDTYNTTTGKRNQYISCILNCGVSCPFKVGWTTVYTCYIRCMSAVARQFIHPLIALYLALNSCCHCFLADWSHRALIWWKTWGFFSLILLTVLPASSLQVFVNWLKTRSFCCKRLLLIFLPAIQHWQQDDKIASYWLCILIYRY